MQDEQTNKTDTQGTEIDKGLSDLEKLKADNDEFEKELIKGREMRSEMQKIESEKLLGGTSGGHIEAKIVSPEDQKKAQAKEFFKGTALEEAIDKL